MEKTAAVTIGFLWLLLLLVFPTPASSPPTFLVPHAEATENSWTTKQPMPEGLCPEVAVVNGKIYAIARNVTYEYDPATDTWATKKPMPTPRGSFAIAVYQNKIHVIGGADAQGRETGVNEVYDPATDTWETKTSMPTPRSQLNAHVVNGKIYMIGGLLPESVPPTPLPPVSNITEVYNPATDSWTTKASIPTPVFAYASAVVNNKIYVIGGSRPLGAPNLNQIYDPETDTWSYGTPIPTPVSGAAAGATAGVMAPKRIYVIGGRINYSMDGTNINQVYNPENDSWTIGTSMPTARYSLAVAVANDILYAMGGMRMFNLPPDLTAANEQYTPFGFGTLPIISIISPEKKTYTVNNVSLTFTVSKPTSWIGYSLDGQAIVKISGNTTLTWLSDGMHSLVVYAKDAAGNTGTSETIYFSIKTQHSEPLPITWIAAAIVIIAVVGTALLVYFKKIRKTTGKVE